MWATVHNLANIQLYHSAEHKILAKISSKLPNVCAYLANDSCITKSAFLKTLVFYKFGYLASYQPNIDFGRLYVYGHGLGQEVNKSLGILVVL